MIKENIFSNIPHASSNEIFDPIIRTPHTTIERIVSRGQVSPENFWYDQDRHEWVIVLKGRARLRFQDQDTAVEMKAGDYINIPAHRKHRVEWTDPSQETIWLAVHY